MPKDGDSQLFDNVEFDFSIVGAESNIDDVKTKEEQTAVSDEDKNKDTKTDDPNEDGLIDINLSTDDDTGSTSTTVDTDSSDSSSSPLSSLPEILGAEGFIDYDADELAKAKDPAAYIREQLEAKIQEGIAAGLSPKELEAFKAYSEGVPLKELVASNARETMYSNVTEEQMGDVKTQRTLVAHSLQAKGMSETDALEYVKAIEDLGGDKLKEKALVAKVELVSREKQHKADLITKAAEDKVTATKANEDSLKEIKKFVYDRKEVVPNLPLTDKVKEQVYNAMTTVVGKDANGNAQNIVGQTRSKDTVKFDFRLNYYHSLGLFDDKPDFSKLQKLADSKSAKSLDNLMGEGTNFIKSGGSKNAKTDANDGDLGLGGF